MSIEAETPNRMHFAIWRRHFDAGLCLIPFLLMRAVTGLIMLWIAVLTGIGDEKQTITPGGRPPPVSKLAAAAEAAVPGGVATRYVAPFSPEDTATQLMLSLL